MLTAKRLTDEELAAQLRTRRLEALAELARLRRELADIDTGLLRLARETGAVQECGCRSPRTLHPTDPGHECHGHWRERTHRERGWTV